MKDWVKCLRLKTVSLAVVLYFCGFSLIDWEGMSYLAPFFILIAGSATMAFNDWVDRYHDLAKGKDLALSRPGAFKALVIGLWLVSAVLVIAIFAQSFEFGIISLILTGFGMMYFATRRTPMLPGLYVALVSGGPLFYSIAVKPTKYLLLLLFCVVLFIYAREVVKDLDDVEIDRGYKWTLPVVLGIGKSKVISLAIFTLAFFVATLIEPSVMYLLPFLALIAYLLLIRKHHYLAKLAVDVLTAIALLVIVFTK